MLTINIILTSTVIPIIEPYTYKKENQYSFSTSIIISSPAKYTPKKNINNLCPNKDTPKEKDISLLLV